jgi:hypothetical protein
MSDQPNPPLLKTSELPLPRLELRWDADDAPPPDGYPAGARACRYLIVLPLDQWDIRREDENCEQVRSTFETEMRCTVRSGGGNQPLVWLESNSVDTPYRDRAHIVWDSHVLNLPAYVTAGEHAMFLDPVAPRNLPPYADDEVTP